MMAGSIERRTTLVDLNKYMQGDWYKAGTFQQPVNRQIAEVIETNAFGGGKEPALVLVEIEGQPSRMRLGKTNLNALHAVYQDAEGRFPDPSVLVGTWIYIERVSAHTPNPEVPWMLKITPIDAQTGQALPPAGTPPTPVAAQAAPPAAAAAPPPAAAAAPPPAAPPAAGAAPPPAVPGQPPVTAPAETPPAGAAPPDVDVPY